MRLFNDKLDKSMGSILLLLTPSEAEELRNTLDDILSLPPGETHEHVSSSDYQKEITVATYDESAISQFHSRVQKLIRDDQ
jgi:hypothetical protein